MKELISNEKRTVLIVSHSLDTIKSLCDKVLWLNDGEVMMLGSVNDVLPKYKKYMKL